MSAPHPGLDRSGHLSELALDRLDTDDRALDPSFFEATEAHLATCDRCRDRLDARRREAVSLTPTPAVVAAWTSPRAVRGGHPWRRLGGVGLVFAAAAAVLLVTRLAPDDDDGVRKKGAALHFEVHVHDGRAERLVGTGDRVRPGERAAFGVRPDAAGYLVIFGWDATGEPYPVWPYAAAARDAAALPIARLDVTLPLPVAVRFDATPGPEHLVAILCPEPFRVGDVVPARGLAEAGPRVPVGCARREVVLDKAR